MKKLASKAIKGFTLIELMIVVAIIGILAAIAIPKFADLVTKSKESAVKGSLGSLRSAVSIYYSDTEGIFPDGTTGGALMTSTLAQALCLGSKYLKELPFISIPKTSHSTTNTNNVNSTAALGDTPGWFYSSAEGHVAVNCTHTDTKSSTWSTW